MYNSFLQTLHNVCRIADVLIALQQAGNVNYTEWELSFGCEIDSVGKLQSQARQMEIELQDWKEEVQKAREEFYELNYYRTLQLLSLRSELAIGKHLDSHHTVIDPAVQALLHSISPEIATSSIIVAVQNAAAVVQNRGQDSQTSASVNLSKNTALENKVEVEESCSNIVADVLASADTQAAVSLPPEVPQAKLTLEELSDKQKEIFANLTGYGEFHPQLALLALEKYKEDDYEMDNWCLENAARFKFPKDDLEDLGDQESESDESESEDEHFSNAIGNSCYLITNKLAAQFLSVGPQLTNLFFLCSFRSIPGSKTQRARVCTPLFNYKKTNN